jgi:colanic acid biosynthesis glycosyl transferase WcaI
MKVLFVGLNHAPEPVGIGPYTTGAARALVAAGHQVEVIAGKPYYPAWRHDPAFALPLYHHAVEDGVAITRVPHYVPARQSGLRRILHHASFAAAALPVALRRARSLRPDLVIGIAPSLIAAPVARAAATFAGAPLWLHVQDFEVEAAFATGLIAEEGIGARVARGFESGQLRRADRVSSISPQMCARLRTKGVSADRIVEFRNWAEIDSIRPLDRPSTFRARWGIDRPHVALYSGNIANKQGIGIILEVALLLRHRRDLLFVICGEGPNRDPLAAAIAAAGLDNVRLERLQPAAMLPDLLGLATIHLLPQIRGAADLVLPSKLANMLASGRPVAATALAGTGIANEVAGCGIVTEPGDARALGAAIETLLDDTAGRETLGRAARLRAEERWSRDRILARFVQVAEAAVGRDSRRQGVSSKV